MPGPPIRRSGVKSIADLVSAGQGPARQNPITSSSPGPGSLGHLLIEQFKRKAGIDIQHVPAPNSGVTDVLGNHISMTLTAMMTVGEQVKAGQLVALAVTSTERNPVFKGIPTFAEQGYPDVRGSTWFWLCGPKGLPPDVVNKLSEATRRIVKSPKVQDHFQKLALLSKDLDVAAVQAFLAEEYAFWAPLATRCRIEDSITGQFGDRIMDVVTTLETRDSRTPACRRRARGSA